MKLKIIIFSAALSCFTISQGFSADVTNRAVAAPIETPASVRAEELKNRLEEIKTMDIKNMSRAEKKSLRKEVRNIEKEMKRMDNGGIYISVGALLVIILLILIL